jgi:predicted DNA binding protein
MDHANRTMNVGSAGWFGDEDDGQLAVTVGKPFLAATVTNHGGRLIDVIAGPDSTRLRIHLPANATERPLIEALTERFGDVELVSRREVDGPSGRPGTDPESLLTDRQREVLRAAYHGGYYETPRGVTGEDLADSFGISNSVIYDHLQAAHRTLLETVFDSPADDAGRNL